MALGHDTKMPISTTRNATLLSPSITERSSLIHWSDDTYRMRLFAALVRPATSLAFASSSSSRSSYHHHAGIQTRQYYYSTRASFGDTDHGDSSTNSINPSSSLIMDQYDAFILDQFGVLHNGLTALEGARELCQYLHQQQKKKLVILSNTSAPSDKALDKLEHKLGFVRDWFVGAITSGDEAAKYIRETYNNKATTTTKALMLTWDTSIANNPRLSAPPQAFLDLCGSHIQVASSVDDADFVLLHGSEVWHRGNVVDDVSLGSFIVDGSYKDVIDPLLQQCLDRNLPLVCANPDFVVTTPTGGMAYMPGKIGQRYAELREERRTKDTTTGLPTIHSFGKPNPEHFAACLRIFQEQYNIPAHRVAHVGDSLHHDIAGATAAGIDSIFVTNNGIHSQDLSKMPSLSSKASLDERSKARQILDALFAAAENTVPTHVVEEFRL
jgi:HAD superfamily hydrolase (TIGR01450 family)